jgi:hypothetical protein
MPFCNSTKHYTDQPQVLDTITGQGQQQRSQIYSQLNQNQGAINQGTQAYAGGLKAAAADPGWATAAAEAGKTAGGGYLGGSPQLQGQLDANYNRALASSADQDARIRSQFARSGMSFSTANQQAQEANRAAAAAQAQGQNAQIIGQNYMAERQLQSQAPQQLASATGVPLSYLGAVPGAYMSPLQTQAGLVQGLSTGQVATPSTAVYNKPGIAEESGLTSLIGNL